MTAKQTALPFRSDTMLGVCQALGEDFGFHPNILRIAFASVLLWNPPVVIGTYLGLGLLVAVSRFAFPKTVATAAPQAKVETANADVELPLAA